jgi:hypothetical protein
MNSADVEISASTTRTPAADAPIIRLDNVRGAFVHGCQANADTQVFLQVAGANTQSIVLRGNHLVQAKQPLAISSEVQPDAVWIDALVKITEAGDAPQ